eukprot:gnl/MRDRNA2_/MRDRNA2_90061_c0_seq1.p1 gnl/MRDRNA2_/MRDRNA2_90061_c0~~gnl/MRDRNA2_/MRDRNA2_90061_c0_seq1.p1  ORF type:complete len:315 (+),score=69.20 gnl/MRDRNA2_/MRDRNA2_90061_c0_seq1:112-1056(+)
MTDYLLLDGKSVDEASRPRRSRMWALCCGVMSAGALLVLCEIAPGGLTVAKEEPSIAMAVPTAVRQLPGLAKKFPQWSQSWQPVQPTMFRQFLQPLKADPRPTYGVKEGIALIKKGASSKFDETIDVAVNLKVDPKRSDQRVRGVTQLPAGTGKTLRVAVFAKGPKADDAREAGADVVGDSDLAEKISKEGVDFDKVIASPDMMPTLAKLARILGPKGLMPNPKLGTVTDNIAEAVKAAKAGQVEFRMDKTGIVHAGIGKSSFSDEDLETNLRAFMGALMKEKPPSLKGGYVKTASLSSTQGAGIRLDLSDAIP